MKKIGELVNISPPSKKSSERSPSEGLVEKLWTAGALIFGDKWIHKHGEYPAGEWNNVFLAFDENQIATGIKRMRADAEAKIRAGDEAWPPSAFEFACYCKTVNSLYFPDAMKALPPPRPSREKARAELAKIREKL